MYIFEAQFKLKPDVDADEMFLLFSDLAVPIYRKIPGCISVNLLKYTGIDNRPPECDYAFIEVWESKEANGKAMSDRYIATEDSQLAQTGVYEEFRAMVDKTSMANATPVVSSQ